MFKFLSYPMCLLAMMAAFMAFPSQSFADEVQQTQIKTLNTKVVSEGHSLDVKVLRKSDKTGKLPAIIFLVGSGEGSTLATYKNMLNFFFENSLLEQGFAVVYFDKRGAGNSEGTWYTTTFEQRARDARNVAKAVKELDFIDPTRLFAVGHSQGGWIVQTALAEYPDLFAGGISMAGPTFSVKKQLINDYKSSILCDEGLDEAAALRSAERKVGRDLFFISLIGWTGNLKQLNLIKDFEPAPYLAKIKRPLLLLYAENDPLVSPQWSLTALQDIFPAGIPEWIEYDVAKGQVHSFKIAPKCYRGKWRDIPFSETTRTKIVNWLVNQAGTAAI
jgi:uncharacterized protein